MSLLHLISFLATLLALAFILICLASGLLYVAEIIEEHSQAAKRIGQQIAHGVILLHIGIYLSDGLPLHLTILGIFSHMIYLTNFSKSWPMISLNSISFLSSCFLVILDHFAWFFYFTDRNSSHHPYHSNQAYRAYGVQPLTFLDVTTFFAICVWMVPFYLFLSLSANDNVLPSRNDLDQPMISAQPPTPILTNQELIYDPVQFNSLPTPLTLPSLKSNSLLKGILQSCLPNLKRTSSLQVGRTSSNPNQGLIASPSLTSSPSTPWLNSQFFPPLPAKTPPPSPPPSLPLSLDMLGSAKRSTSCQVLRERTCATPTTTSMNTNLLVSFSPPSNSSTTTRSTSPTSSPVSRFHRSQQTHSSPTS